MADMLVNLYGHDFKCQEAQLKAQGITFKKPLALDKMQVLNFVEANFEHKSWAHEVEASLFKSPPTCWVAVKDKEIVGFACYDTTAKGFFGPTGVKEDFRKQGIGGELLVKSMTSLKEAGYAYSIIGWANPEAMPLYERRAGATIIAGSELVNSIYSNLIGMDKTP